MFFADGNEERSEGKRTVRGRFFGSNRAKRLVFEAKNEFSRRFSEGKSHHVGEFGAGVFQAALILNGLKIICNV
jgi:hypothetical protein